MTLIYDLFKREKHIFLPFKNLFLKYLIWLQKKNNLCYLKLYFFLPSAVPQFLLPQMYSQVYFFFFAYIASVLHIYIYMYIYCNSFIYIYIYITIVHSFGNECFFTNWAFTCCLWQFLSSCQCSVLFQQMLNSQTIISIKDLQIRRKIGHSNVACEYNTLYASLRVLFTESNFC